MLQMPHSMQQAQVMKQSAQVNGCAVGFLIEVLPLSCMSCILLWKTHVPPRVGAMRTSQRIPYTDTLSIGIHAAAAPLGPCPMACPHLHLRTVS